MKRKILFFAGMMILLAAMGMAGCGKQKVGVTKIRDLELTVVSEDKLPQELYDMLQEKLETPFKITYSDGNYLYICVGYGRQETGGYSITVNEFYLTENAVYLDTNLIGPASTEVTGEAPSYPYIVVKTELMNTTVVFD